ncbi:MAG TPA: bifunctional uroporphyrinogen-III C-methyltransferase/uroporphyrinogen-III synthase [Mycobacteriales bacterium]|nr:bifunctional uroporphyrinogen-III C-methyltransferase/uroporphyrinogen-III synthase [Mycobacteriales bacterium]
MSTSRTKKKVGLVTFVGGGPGDPGLLTVRGADALAEADVVVIDRLAREQLLRHCRADAEIVDAAGFDHSERAKAVVAAAKEGRRVVRLLDGDSALFGGLAEEAEACAKAKLPVEIVPGVSAVTAVPAYAGIPVTDRKSHAVHVVDVGPEAPEPDWATLAATPGTLVLLNCVRAIGKVAAALVEHGMRGDTAVAVTSDGTTRDQHTVVSTLDAVERDAASMAPPAVAVVGDVVRLRDKLSWWETKPLFGWKVLVPRTKDQAAALSEQLVSYGAVPVEVPTIAVEPPRTPQAMDRAIRGLVSGRYAWVAFTSTNAVKAVREKIEELGLDARALAGVKVACVGEQTAAAVRGWGITPELVPSGEQSSDGLLVDWPAYDDVYDPLDRVFLPRADIATETLVAGLIERGWQVDDVTAYRTVRAAPPPAEIREAIKTGGFDAVLFTSSSTVRNLVGIAGKPHASSVIAVIGPQTAQTAEELGLRVDVMAAKPSAAQLAEALAEFGRSRRESDDALPPGKANRTKAAARLKKAK